jgi:competence protein ComEC
MADILHNRPYIGKMSSAAAGISIHNLPVARILLPFLLGILMGDQTSLPFRPEMVCLATSVCWVALFILVRNGKAVHPRYTFVLVMLVSSIFTGTGYTLGTISKPETDGIPVGEKVMLRGEVLQEAVPARSGWFTEVRMQMLVHGDSCIARTLLLRTYLRTAVGGMLPRVGESWQLAGTLVPIRNRGNPGEIDYEAILSRKGYRYRFYVDGGSEANRKLNGMVHPRISAAIIRKRIADYWDGTPESEALLRAVCLGDRTALTDEQKRSYRDAGGMHLLAVSGLHIGLIWWFLHRALEILVRIFRRELFRMVPSVMLLWLYACLTGFSSSVCRSVTMFTLFSLALFIDQRSQPVNSLFLSAFLILAIDPDRVLDAGFQLSYAAVFGIVTLFPWFRKLPGSISNRLLRWIWELNAVSMAAQVATMPLVVFYFHQFPAYGLLTNLMAIPLLSILMGMFILSLPLIILDLFTPALSRIITWTADLMNHSMEVIAGFPGAVIGELQPDRGTLFLLLVATLLGVLAIQDRKHWPRYGLMLVFTALNSWGTISGHMRKHSSLLLVTHFNRGSQILISQGEWMDCYRFSADSMVAAGMDQYLSNSWNRMNLQTIEINSNESQACHGRVSACHPVADGCWLLGNDHLKGWMVTEEAREKYLELILQNPGSFIVLSGNARLSHELIGKLSSVKWVIADGSNSHRYVEQLKGRIPLLHVTAEQGAFEATW